MLLVCERTRRILVLLLLGTLIGAGTAGAQQEVKSEGQPPRAGVNGTGTPQCIYCPQPEYSDEARAAKCSGTVLLDVTVSAGGKVTEPVVLRSPGIGLDEKALSQMSEWRMKPALGADGKPVDCRVQIEVTFGIYQDSSALNEAKGVAGVCIDRAQAAALQLGYHGLLLGQEAYVAGTKTPNSAVSLSGCIIEEDGSSPTLDEQFFSISGSTVCVVDAGKNGRINRIVVDSRTSVPDAIEILTHKYGRPLPGLYRVINKGPMDATLWAWEFPAENGTQRIKASISVEPKIRNQRKDEYASYVEVVFQQ